MLFFILLIIVGGLAWWGLWTLFIKSAVWTVKPLIKYFEEEKANDITAENDVPEKGSGKVVITVSSLQQNGSQKEERIEVGSSNEDDIVANNNLPKEVTKPEIDPKTFQFLKGKRQVRLTCRCPECRKFTTCYDVDIQKGRCTNCNWVNKVDPPMTLEEYVKVYYMLIDPSELDIKDM